MFQLKRSFSSLVVALVATIGFAACSEPKTNSEVPGSLDLSENDDTGIFESLLVINSLSEDFSVIESLDAEPQVRNHLSMSPDSNSDRLPCQGVSDGQFFGSLLYVTCSLSHQVHVFNASDLSLQKVIKFDLGTNPSRFVVINENLAVASLFGANKVLLARPAASLAKEEQRIISQVDLSELSLSSEPEGIGKPRPGGIVVKEGKAYVALAHLNDAFSAAGPAYLAVIDLEDGVILQTYEMTGKNAVSVISGTTESTEDNLYVIQAGSYKEGVGYLGDGVVDVFDLSSSEITASIAIDGAPFEGVIAEDGVFYLSNGKEGVIKTFDGETFERGEDIDIRDLGCEKPDKDQLSFVSSLIVDQEFLYATEFNSDCLLQIKRSDLEVTQSLKVGDGPDVLVRIK